MLSLLDRNLVVVTGKGGTGKTTVVSALGLAAAKQGSRALLVETGRDPQIPSRLGVDIDGSDGEIHALAPGLDHLLMSPHVALREYLSLQLPGGAGWAGRILDIPAFRTWLDAVPGWRELITLGKVWHLAQQTDGDRPLYDSILVDAPATGHGLTFLDVPGVAAAAVRAGPLHRHAAAVEDLLRDPVRTVVLPVALPEETPVSETLELLERLQADLEVPVDRVVVNSFEAAPLADPPGLRERLDQWQGPEARCLAECVAHVDRRHTLHEAQRARLAGACGLPLVTLPRLASGIIGAEDLSLLAGPLLADAVTP